MHKSNHKKVNILRNVRDRLTVFILKKNMGTRRRYTTLDHYQKCEIIAILLAEPEISNAEASKYFTTRFDMPISSSMIKRLMIVPDITALEKSCGWILLHMTFTYKQFEDDLEKEINKLLEKTLLASEEIKTLAVRLQHTIKYKNSKDVQNATFCDGWWEEYKQNRGIQFKKNVASVVTMGVESREYLYAIDGVQSPRSFFKKALQKANEILSIDPPPQSSTENRRCKQKSITDYFALQN